MDHVSPHADSTAVDDIDANAMITPHSHNKTSSQVRNKHVELLGDLLYSLDSLIYIEVSCLYYLDCMFGFLLLRALVQNLCLSTRPGPPARLAIGAVLGSNVLCTLLHAVKARPEAGESTGFFLNGSIVIDFVGQLGPTPKPRLFAMDMLLLFLQVLMLVVGIERTRVENIDKEISPVRQDLEAEEMGIAYSHITRDNRCPSNNSIEMQELFPTNLQESSADLSSSNTHVLDEFYTGSAILGRLDMVEVLRGEI
jgi:Fungal domain of unknown function (DUF1746)